jgi:hypothetical protein
MYKLNLKEGSNEEASTLLQPWNAKVMIGVVAIQDQLKIFLLFIKNYIGFLQGPC